MCNILTRTLKGGEGLKKILKFSLFAVIVGAIVFFLYNYRIFNNIFNEAGIVSIGKTLEVSINKDNVRDYSFVENNIELSKWNENEKRKFIKYMKENNLILEPGSYKINQGTTYEKAKEIFKFE